MSVCACLWFCVRLRACLCACKFGSVLGSACICMFARVCVLVGYVFFLGVGVVTGIAVGCFCCWVYFSMRPVLVAGVAILRIPGITAIIVAIFGVVVHVLPLSCDVLVVVALCVACWLLLRVVVVIVIVLLLLHL